MKWRSPDKPQRISPYGFRDTVDSFKGYIAQSKLDGYRCVISTEGGELSFISRHQRKLDVGPDIVKAIQELDIPPDCQIDSEWMARRVKEELDHEMLYLFGPVWWENKWVGSQTEGWRIEHLENFVGGKASHIIKLPKMARNNLFDFFEEQVGDWLTEGVVVKHIDSKLVGHLKTSAINKRWNKVKWRDGPAGTTITYGQEDEG